MRQRGFTLLEMMLVVLLIGSAASLVMMSFPAAQRNTPQQQLVRFQAQLDFALDDSQQNGRLLGIQVRPDGWEFKLLQRQQPGNSASAAGSDIWQGYFWQTWQPRRSALGSELPDDLQLELQYPGLQEWPPVNAAAAEPDILLLPGGEVTPFTLVFRSKDSSLEAWLRVDEAGVISTSEHEATP
ncbi:MULTISPECIES: type II secretion system minor pseudopilin GspH [unclassified Serratia (in: enterobacteria)]|uniref:type II secretion system minor pseudopilin GspH n=1 Tax=unclassified Serratia (in: enterobacteria) TaxID=2647522 RepID=UPI00050365A2|nr:MULTISPECIES: type II secretion system minor pseudopilin GspH [unclassified Serratia (in: enterobacteria)]KFK91781.1 general secretion pathway protein GspH [Serratia sp. Ag2]KFK93139.1 general secretion pathway protein GspH [Serratia sp. Ag1]